MLSVIVPVLNAAESLPGAIQRLASDVDEIVVVDGGSSDGSFALAEAAGARALRAPRGRGGQLAAGARAAKGDWLLFLHVDTTLALGWRQSAHTFMAGGCDQARAAYFQLAFDDASRPARRTARWAGWRAAALGLPYGDQGLLIGRAFYEALGGYQDMPLMEDVDLVRRIGRSRLHALPATAVTSAARYRQSGWRRRSARNLCCLGLYFLGVSPQRIARIYG